MENLRYSRGHFFGIIIPGAFFLINILFIHPNLFNSLIAGRVNFELNQIGLGMSLILFVISYVIGIGLRLLKSSWIEKLATTVKLPIFLASSLFEKIIAKKGFQFKPKLKLASQNFPYIDWFYDVYLIEASKDYRDFYNDTILKDQYSNNRDLLKRSFFNSSKTYIHEYSDNLSDEVMFNEGLTRFISGISYSLCIFDIILLFNLENHYFLFWIYLGMLLLFILRLRTIRTKEALSVFDGYAILKLKERK